MSMLTALRRRWALQGYVRCWRLLVARYGVQGSYRPGQVRATLEKSRLSLKYLEHALAMYSSLESFHAWRLDQARAALTPGDARGTPGSPYRMGTGAVKPLQLPSPAVSRARYLELRAEAARYNKGSYAFLPEAPNDYDIWVPISNLDAIGSKALIG